MASVVLDLVVVVVVVVSDLYSSTVLVDGSMLNQLSVKMSCKKRRFVTHELRGEACHRCLPDDMLTVPWLPYLWQWV